MERAFWRGLFYTVLVISIIVLIWYAYERNSLWQDGVSIWHDAIKKSPQKPRPYAGLGDAYRFKSQMGMAIEYYQAALRLNPNYVIALNNLGIAYGEKGLVEKAVEYYKKALQINPYSSETHFNLGVIYVEMRLWEDARIEFEKALQIKPGYVDASMFLDYVIKHGKEHQNRIFSESTDVKKQKP